MTDMRVCNVGTTLATLYVAYICFGFQKIFLKSIILWPPDDGFFENRNICRGILVYFKETLYFFLCALSW
jgi:hypothetical protein